MFQVLCSMFRTKRGGFTLIEILVVLGVTTLLSAYLIIYNSGNRQQVALGVEQAKLTQFILRAKSLAIATVISANTPCGYGVHLDYNQSRYAIFRYEGGGCATIASIDPSDPNRYVAIDSAQMPPALGLDPSGIANLRDVFFEPPDPTTWLWDTDGTLVSNGKLTAHLVGTTGSFQAAVSVSAAGEVGF